MSLPPLEDFLRANFFSSLDRHFAKQLAAWAPQSRLAGHAAALASLMLHRGHLCLELGQPPNIEDDDGGLHRDWPSVVEWRTDLLTSGVVATDTNTFLPLVLDSGNRLYLHRYAEYEQHVAVAIRERLAAGCFTALVGGPGTGKTHTILKIMIERLGVDPDLRILLAAPTGKAAQRMQESVQSGLSQLADATNDAAVMARIPREASTLHRLLGTRGDSSFFRHDANNPLPADLLIIDEASMVDLPMMAKLLEALAPGTQLILVGDPDQLASVETGAVLADIVSAASSQADLAGAVRRLTKQYRYSAQSGIGRLCDAIRNGDHAAVIDILEDPGVPDVRLRAVPTRAALPEQIGQTVVFAMLREAIVGKDPHALLVASGKGKILCPSRTGPFGVDTLNDVTERMLAEQGLIDVRNRWYDGRPVLVLRNDYDLGLFNGDSGVIFADQSAGEAQAMFSGMTGTLRKIAANRLPAHQTNFAMTVHRSQGSEFDRVLIILPSMQSPILTRELFYTAVSRARADVEIWAEPLSLRAACERRVGRASGLAERLVPQAGRAAHAG